MTDNEFKRELSKLINKLPETRNVFVILYDDETKGNVKLMGIGCQACGLEIAEAVKKQFNPAHNRDIH